MIENTVDPGQDVLLYPGWHFSAGAALTSPAVADQVVYVGDQSGTLLVELEVQNPDGALKPGDFAQVRFDLPPASGVVRVPASALVFRSAGLQVATVTPDGRALVSGSGVRDDVAVHQRPRLPALEHSGQRQDRQRKRLLPRRGRERIEQQNH